MADITETMSLVDSAPEEAAQNISGGSVFQMGADVFKDQKETLQPMVEKLKLPVESTENISRYIAQSKEHAALAAPDIDQLSKVETKVKDFGDRFKGKDIEQEFADLSIKKHFNPNSFTQDDEVKLSVLGEEVKEYQKYRDDNPGKHDDLIVKVTEQNKETTLAEDLYNSLGKGFADVLSTVGKTPAFLSDVANIQANKARAKKGLPPFVTSEELINNPLVQKFERISTEFGEKVPRLGRSISDTIRQGDYAEAGRIAAAQLAANAPNQALLLLSMATGFGEVGLIAAGTMTAAQANEENRRAGIPVGESVTNAAIKGGIEAGFERLGTFGLLKTWESALVKSYGKQKAGKVILNTTKAILYSTAGEANEEALTSVAQDVTDYVTGINPNALEGIGQRAVDAGIIGGLSGATMTGPTAAITAATKVRQGNREAKMTKQAIDALHFDSLMTDINKMSQETKMSKTSPAEMTNVMKSLLGDNGVQFIYLAKEEMNKWANTPEKAENVRNIIDPSGAAAAAINAPFQVEAHKFMEVLAKHPELSELAKLSPESPNALEAKTFLENLHDAQVKRSELLVKLGSTTAIEKGMGLLGIQTEAEKTLEKASTIVTDPNFVFNEQDYMNQPTFTPLAEENLPKAEVERMNEAQKEVRQGIVDSINDTAKYEMDRVKTEVLDQAMQVRIEVETERLKNDPNIKVVDQFTDIPETTPIEQRPNIDPNSLSEKQKIKYLDNPQLKKHRVFVKGGQQLADSARMVGVNSGENLLRILANTPSRQEIINRQVALGAQADIDAVNEAVDLNETAMARAFSAVTANRLAELKVLRDKLWPTLRQGLRRVVKGLPTVQELNVKAKSAVMSIKVGELNSKQFEVGHRKSQLTAFDEMAKNNLENAYVNLEAAALNSELAKESKIAIGKVNRALKSVRRFNKPEVIEDLRKAGKLYENAVTEILDVFNLNKTKKGLVEQGQFQKYVQEMYDKGEGNFEIPERLSDIRDSVNNMTVEQFLLVAERLDSVLHTARNKNKLSKKWGQIKELQELEQIAEIAEQKAQEISDYKPERNDVKQAADKSWFQRFGEGLADLQAYLERSQHIIAKLDGGKLFGFFSDLIYVPIAKANDAEKKLGIETRNQLEKVIEKFGTKEFENLASEFVSVPEFENIKTLNNGQVSKMQLLMMNLNRGNEGNLRVLERWEINREVFKNVLERELELKHMELTQDIWNIWKSFEKPVVDLQKRTTNKDMEMVKSIPLEFTKNNETRVYEGGYFPIHYIQDEARNAAERLRGSSAFNQAEGFKQRYYAQAMTEQGHTETRTSTDRTLDLDPNRIGFSLGQVIHDLTTREAIIDVTKVLEDSKIRHSMISVIGKDGYEVITNMVTRVADASNLQSYGRLEKGALGVLQKLEGRIQTQMIAAKLTSIMIQPASLFLAFKRMGGLNIGGQYFTKTLYRVINNPKSISAFMDFAAEINPDIRNFREDMDKNVALSLNEIMPSKKMKYLDPLIASQQMVLNVSFGALGIVDQFNKTIVTISAYTQAIEGKVEGIEAGDHEASAKYARLLVEATQTSNQIRNLSEAQNNKWLKWALFFYNDASNLYNDAIHTARQAREKYQITKAAIDEEEWKTASKFAAQGIGGLMSSMMILSAMKLFEAAIRGQPTPFDGLGDDPEEAMKDMTYFYLTSPVDAVVGAVPFARDVKYASEKYWELSKKVDMPIDKTLGTFATSLAGMKQFLKTGGAISDQQGWAILDTLGIVTNLPLRTLYKNTEKTYNWVTAEKSADPVVIQDSLITSVSKKIEGYLNKNRTNPDLPEEFIKELERQKNELNPKGL